MRQPQTPRPATLACVAEGLFGRGILHCSALCGWQCSHPPLRAGAGAARRNSTGSSRTTVVQNSVHRCMCHNRIACNSLNRHTCELHQLVCLAGPLGRWAMAIVAGNVQLFNQNGCMLSILAWHPALGAMAGGGRAVEFPSWPGCGPHQPHGCVGHCGWWRPVTAPHAAQNRAKVPSLAPRAYFLGASTKK